MLLENIHRPSDIRALSRADMGRLASEIRRELVHITSKNGGHLASNLGVVELKLALHAVFDCPRDALVFDVGHQAYVHKMLTGRFSRMDTLRQSGGLAGFPRREESEFDAFTVGHASTAISAALGMARARDLVGEDSAVVAIVGDGALTGGMCYEALNDAGQSETQLIVVLNDNEMSISPNVGALSGYLTGLRQSGPYRSVKRAVRSGLERVPHVGRPLIRLLSRLRDAVRSVFVDGQFFEALGFDYMGPIDGADTERMMRVLRRAKAMGKPVLVHVITQKGRGYSPAEDRPDEFHGVAPFYIESGLQKGQGAPQSGGLMAEKLAAMADADPRVVAVCAAMPGGTGLTAFQQRHGNRFFDVGIAEEHAVTMAAGLAAAGLRPYVCVYSTFMQRAFDQILMDVCLHNLPVTLLLDRAGLVGPDGATHQGVFDLSYLSPMPNLVIAAPRDRHEFERMLDLSLTLPGPMAIRYPKESCDMGPNMVQRGPLRAGEWELLNEGADAVILACGSMVELALAAAIELSGRGVECGVVDARFIKPLDDECLRRAAGKTDLIVTLEENSRVGGFGASVLLRLSELGIRADAMVLGVPDRFIEHGPVERQREEAGLLPTMIADTICERRAMRNGRTAG